VDFFY
jgi:hypothetical protein